MTRMGVVRHKIDDFSDWKQKFDDRMAVRKSNGWAGHELYYDELRKEAYVVHTVLDDKIEMAKQHMAKYKAMGKRNEMNPSGNPDHSILPKGNKVEDITY
ncbi:hypothetical protein [Methanothrix sp.]|jgi:hypothetical protein|uniref:hypothetical protein n=1 Tax=Methanothrix sp. TaxID=90426 RepID=UPI0032AF9537